MKNYRKIKNSGVFPFLLKGAPGITVLILALPVFSGLVGVLLASVNFFPALGRYSLNLQPFIDFFALPGLVHSFVLTLFIGFTTTILSLFVAFFIISFLTQRYGLERIIRFISPVLSVPHVSLALGLSFLLAPSGWLVRIIHSISGVWSRPADLSVIQDGWGLSIILVLIIKEIPFFGLMILSVLSNIYLKKTVIVGKSLGYTLPDIWKKILVPQILPKLRLPIFSVLAFSISVIDVSLVIGPDNPPTLPLLILELFYHPSQLENQLVGSAGAVVLFFLVIFSILCWEGFTKLLFLYHRTTFFNGKRSKNSSFTKFLGFIFTGWLSFLFCGSIFSMLVWSVAKKWRYPDVFPSDFSLINWERHFNHILPITISTLFLGICASAIALFLAVLCLENESVKSNKVATKYIWFLYLPLLIPQISFLSGFQILLNTVGLEGTYLAVLWAHILFVFPYIFLSLMGPYKHFNQQYVFLAQGLGISQVKSFLRVKLPILMVPLLISFAIGFAVSVAQYLPTLFAGAGRYVTVTSEAVALSSGANRKIMGIFTILQSFLPILVFLIIPLCLHFSRRRMQ